MKSTAQSRPIIGVPTQTYTDDPNLPPCWIMSHRYVNTITAAGGVPYVIPLLSDENTLQAIYDTLDGIFICGGVDIDPGQYNEQRHRLLGRVDPDRDRVEMQFVRWAMDDKMPIFGVCRGAQVINVAAGGTLHQDIAYNITGALKHDYFPYDGRYARDLLTHAVAVDTESKLGTLMGVRSAKVNSMHHQAIDRVGQGLTASAWAPDGVVEAVESENGHYVMGVQWHPEELAGTDPRMRRLFTTFVRESLAYHDTHKELRVKSEE